jgi:predicted MFS family arabinose efflux permease
MASALAVLGLGGLAVGTSELVIVGILDPVAHGAPARAGSDCHNAST